MRQLLALVLLAASAAADVSLATIFGDNMVLQRDTKVPIWGRARPRERVTVRYLGQTATARADNSGAWRVEMGPFAINEGAKMLVAGRNKITLHDVCVGEVWICSGQSNMNWPVERSRNGPEEVKRSADSLLRLFTVPRRVAGAPQSEMNKAQWVAAGPGTVKNFSAVAYFFGRHLRRDFDIPIGLIHASVGATPAEAWTRHAVLATTPELKPIVDLWQKIVDEHPQRLREYKNALSDWQSKARALRKQGKPPPGPKPQPPMGPDHPQRAAGLWNGMIAPLIPLAMRGVIWYQGESNAKRAEQYRTLFRLMIRDWRHSWGRGDFPFLFVQLANFQQVQTHVRPSPWAELRDAQRHALKEPNTGMAVTIDIGESWDIHPKNKQEVGRRLALIAKAKAYGETGTVCSGPVLKEVLVDGRHFILHFDELHGGLKTRNDDPVRGFIIAGPDKRFRWAYARLERDTVVVWHPLVPKPAAVRYAWAENPYCNLLNGARLPAGPFRTDDWPGVTAPKPKK